MKREKVEKGRTGLAGTVLFKKLFQGGFIDKAPLEQKLRK